MTNSLSRAGRRSSAATGHAPGSGWGKAREHAAAAAPRPAMPLRSPRDRAHLQIGGTLTPSDVKKPPRSPPHHGPCQKPAQGAAAGVATGPKPGLAGGGSQARRRWPGHSPTASGKHVWLLRPCPHQPPWHSAGRGAPAPGLTRRPPRHGGTRARMPLPGSAALPTFYLGSPGALQGPGVREGVQHHLAVREGHSQQAQPAHLRVLWKDRRAEPQGCPPGGPRGTRRWSPGAGRPLRQRTHLPGSGGQLPGAAGAELHVPDTAVVSSDGVGQPGCVGRAAGTE